jgi:hypothetical protein
MVPRGERAVRRRPVGADARAPGGGTGGVGHAEGITLSRPFSPFVLPSTSGVFR